jgi:hypothetical protein
MMIPNGGTLLSHKKRIYTHEDVTTEENVMGSVNLNWTEPSEYHCRVDKNPLIPIKRP